MRAIAWMPWTAFLVLATAAGAEPPVADSLVTARVTYVVGATVYIDLGTEAGLSEGMKGEILREGRSLGPVEVTYLSSRKASCTVGAPGVTAQVGDLVRFAAPSPLPVETAPAAPPPDAAVPPAPRETAGSPMRRAGFRGRLGIRYLSVRDRTGNDAHFSQPSLDFNLRGKDVGGTPLELFADVRARRTYQSFGEDDGRTRVYLLGAGWGTSSPGPRFTLGRQLSTVLPSTGVFDGARGEYAWEHAAVGAFAGAQPDPVDYAVSTDILQFGLYSQFQGRLAPRSRWGLTGGFATSRADGEPNRDFAFAQGRIQGGALAVYLSQEVDVNRGWKADVEGRSLTWTNTYAMVRYQIVPAIAVRSAFDNRRSVRLYRDRNTPESDFDDGYRQGFSVGGEWRGGRTWGMDLGYRSSRGEHGDARSVTGVLRAVRLARAPVDAALRLTRVDGPALEGWLSSLTVGLRSGTWGDIEVHGGIRSEDRFTGLDAHEDVTWFGADYDRSLWGGWYLLLAAEATRGTAERSNQGYASLTYRF